MALSTSTGLLTELINWRKKTAAVPPSFSCVSAGKERGEGERKKEEEIQEERKRGRYRLYK